MSSAMESPEDHSVKRTVYGVGYNSNSSKFNSKHRGYKTWSDMLKRCYCEKYHSYHRYGGKGVKVCKKWHDFSVFARWFDKNYKEGYCLDKDLLRPKNKIYNPNSCVYIPKRLNVLLTSYKQKKNGYPCGVYRNKGSKDFTMKCVVGGRTLRIGSHKTSEDAFTQYKRLRESYVIEESLKLFAEGSISYKVHLAVINWECPRNSR